MLLIVGLPGAGKTTRAMQLAIAFQAMRLTPDHWMIPLFGDSMGDGKRFVLEGRLISVALQALRLNTSVVLDFGLWGRDERSALRWLARSAGAACEVVYLPVDRPTQLARIAHRQATAPHQTFPMSEAEVDRWRLQFQVPDAAELARGEIPSPPTGWPGWPETIGLRALSCLIESDVHDALEATQLWNVGSVVGLAIDGAPFFLHEPTTTGFDSPAALGSTTTRVEVFVDDPDGFIQRAVTAGADASADHIKDHEAPWGFTGKAASPTRSVTSGWSATDRR